MSLVRRLKRNANNLLKRWNLQVIPLELDFSARLRSPQHVERMVDTLAHDASEWLDGQTVIPERRHFDVRADVASFLAEYLASPFRNPRNGSRFGNLLWLRLLAKTSGADLIIDSGTYTGASAWALSLGAPSAKIVSFDIDLSRVALRVPGVEYVERDWTAWDHSSFAGRRILAYFDDHLDQGRRLREASERGIEIAVFDDDLSLTNFAPFAHGGHALPKISFILDETLEDGEVIRWSADGRDHEWVVDGAAMRTLRALILRQARLPNIAASVGIDQMAYRVVAVGR